MEIRELRIIVAAILANHGRPLDAKQTVDRFIEIRDELFNRQALGSSGQSEPSTQT